MALCLPNQRIIIIEAEKHIYYQWEFLNLPSCDLFKISRLIFVRILNQMRLKNILVPIDFSTYSINALKLAKEIARKAEGTIYLLHVIEVPIDKYSFIFSYIF